jgi:glutathione S-transferase
MSKRFAHGPGLAECESIGGISVPKLVLTYFDFDGSRGEAARLAMHLAGIAFEDKRIARSDWPKLRDTAPYQSLPILEVDGQVIAQSNPINRYVGKLAGLYPTDDWLAALVDELMDAIEDITYKIGNTFALEGEAKKKAREALAAGSIPRFLQQFEARLKAGGGEWFVEKRLTVADLKCFLFVRWLKSGALDHIPADIVDKQAPLLVKHLERVRNQPKIAAYYAARGK